MSSNITQTNYVPKFQISARDRAADRWNANPPSESQARTQRLITYLRRTLPAATVAEPVTSHMANGDATYWRRRVHEIQNEARRQSCTSCKGTGEIWVYIDYPPDPCPRCQLAFIDPDADDVSVF